LLDELSPQRVGTHEVLQLGHRPCVLADLEQRLVAPLDGHHAELLET